MTRVTAVVLSYDSRDVIGRCIDSLLAGDLRTDVELEVVVVDNDSSDATLPFVRASFPKVRVSSTGANLGYSGGNNVAVRQALAEGADHVLLVNPDARVDRHCVHELLSMMDREPTLAAVCPIICFDEPSAASDGETAPCGPPPSTASAPSGPRPN